ncbi:MAG: hypothetical protein KBA51_07515, partial [Kiritimatiellae bacterium]|nr:hypothetical protein [Kiritimatiellia bacterium]
HEAPDIEDEEFKSELGDDEAREGAMDEPDVKGDDAPHPARPSRRTSGAARASKPKISAARKPTGKKSTVRTSIARKPTVRKSTAKKPSARKPAAKKSRPKPSRPKKPARASSARSPSRVKKAGPPRSKTAKRPARRR